MDEKLILSNLQFIKHNSALRDEQNVCPVLWFDLNFINISTHTVQSLSRY
jgi:hypothetical protein